MADVVVAMSGGVDSSVTAALLLEAGHRVSGITMRLRPESDTPESCGSHDAIRDAGRVCAMLGIEHRVLDMTTEFEGSVLRPFADAYSNGLTPNPCVACNDRVKFGTLLEHALAMGADALATGHYARVWRDGSGHPWLRRGVDASKDQSYFLYRVDAARLERVMFPLGELRKDEVRAFAERFGLPVAGRPESQDTCFHEDGRYDAVVSEYAPQALSAGDIVDTEGRMIGRHSGVAHYTVGQRKGLGIGGAGEPLYVIAIDSEANRLIAGARDELAVTRVRAHDAVWRGGFGEVCDVALRYRMAPVPAHAEFADDALEVALASPAEGVAPGQSVVCYRGDVVIGGGVITCAS